MIVHDVAQGSRDWLQLRAGLPTASEAHRIVTPTGKKSKEGQESYFRELVAELIMGAPLESPKMSWMARGNELEADAVLAYELLNDVETYRVGLITNDECTYGASPDRVVSDDLLLEIKSPSPPVHVEYLLYDAAPKKYKPQLQMQLMVTGRKAVDIVSYHPLMPLAQVRVERDEKFLALLEEELNKFVERLAKKKEELRERGMLRLREIKQDPLGVSNEDVDMILEARRLLQPTN